MGADNATYALCKAKLLNDFGFFVRYFFKSQYSKRFVLKPYHFKLFRALVRVVSGECTRLIINIPPRYAKTEVAVKMFVAWVLANSPTAKFIHLSYSDDLALDNSSAIRDLVKSEEFQRFFPMPLRTDSDAKKKWFNTSGGGVYATSAGGAITGFGAGAMGRERTGTGCPADGFGGCFPYDEIVSTELGPMKIGDIVSKRINVRVHSFNFAAGKTELQQIDTFFTNPPNEIIRVHFSDGSTLDCTPNHEIFTKSRGWVEAGNLTADDTIPFVFSDVLELPQRDTKLSANLRARPASIKRNINHILGRLGFKTPHWFGEMGCDGFPCFPHFYLPNHTSANPVLGFQYGWGLGAGENLNNLMPCELRSWSAFKNWKSAVLQRILHVVGFGAIGQVCESIVCAVAISVSAFLSIVSRAHKCLKNRLVDVFDGDYAFDRAAKSKVSVCIRLWLKKFCGLPVLRTLSADESPDASYPSKVADFVGGFKSNNRFPVFIERVGHVDSTYCLEVRGNHNFYSGKSKILVSNCIIIDDPVKPDDAFSDTMRERINRRFTNTIASRVNSPSTPIVVIMQRLHENDMTGFLLAGGSGEQWEHLCLPAIDEDGKPLWEEKHSLEKLRSMEAADPYTFAGQYMQRPSPLAGGVLKPDSIPIIEAIPKEERIEWVRGWDFAGTVTGDWTAGALLGKLPDGRVIIADMVRVRVSPEERDAAMLNTAARDGVNVCVSIPQDPGQSGLSQVRYMVRQLAGYNVKTSPETGSKTVRAMPFAAQLNVGNVLMLKAEWNAALVSEMRMFPNGTFDDQVDACTRAFNHLLGKEPSRIYLDLGEASQTNSLLQQAMPSAMHSPNAGNTCGRCAAFDPASSRCTARGFGVGAGDAGCDFFEL